MERPDSILGQFRENARCRDANTGAGLLYFAPQLVKLCFRTGMTCVCVFLVSDKKSLKIDRYAHRRQKCSQGDYSFMRYNVYAVIGRGFLERAPQTGVFCFTLSHE